LERTVLGRPYADQEVICRQGELGDAMYVVQEGELEVLREDGGSETIVGSLSAGDVFGEMALFDREPRSATVRARGDVRVLTLDRRAFLRQVYEDPSLAMNMLKRMSERVRALDAEVAELKGATSKREA
jgi:CRP/FNR family cyclic AMP-dependent transcriptional regulator